MTSGPSPLRAQERQNVLVKAIALVSVLVMLVVLVFSYQNLIGYVTQNEEIRYSHNVIRELEQVLSIVKDAETGARGYLLSNDDVYLQPYDEATRTLAPHIGELARLIERDTASRKGLEELRSLADLRMRYLKDRISDQRGGLAPPGKPDSALLLTGKETMGRLRFTQKKLVDRYTRILDHQEENDRGLRMTGPGMIAIYSGVALLSVILLFFQMIRALERAQVAERLATRTASELAQEVLVREEAERSWKRVLDSSPSGIMAFNSIRDGQGEVIDFECTRMNEAAEAIVHKKAEEMMHRSILEVHPENLGSPLFLRYVQVVETGVPFRTETEYTRDGQTSSLAVSAVRLLDGLVVTFTDITEVRRLAILAQEGERLSVTGRFARMIGHEVRNPLTNIQLALDELAAEEAKIPEQQIYLDIVRRNAQRIGQLITEMLHTSRPLEMKMVPGSLNDVLADALAHAQDRCELRKAKCTQSLHPGLANIPIDKATLTVAFTNLLVNAVEAMEEGKGELVISSERVRNRTQVTVRDNGKGMSPEDRERIFQPFFSGRKGGMGLGLTEARNIFNAHGVLLTVESELGKGTTFRLLFPD